MQNQEDETFYGALIKQIYREDHVCAPDPNMADEKPYEWTREQVVNMCSKLDEMFGEPPGFNLQQIDVENPGR